MTNDNGKIKGDKLKLWAIIFLAILMVFTVAAVIFGLKLPKTNREIAGGEDNFTSQTLFSEDKILYSTTKELRLSDSRGKTEKTVDVKNAAKEKFGVDIGKISAVYKEKGSDNVYVAAMNTETDARYVLWLNSELELLSENVYDGNYDSMKAFGGRLYVFSRAANYVKIFAYPSDLSGEAVKGHLYTGYDDGNVNLELSKGDKILSVDGKDGEVVVVTNQGVHKFKADLSGCGYYAAYEDKLAELKEENPSEKLNVLKRRAEDFVNAEYGSEYNVTFSMKGTVTADSEEYDKSEYYYVSPEVNAFAGSAYNAENGYFYVTSSENELYKFRAENVTGVGFGEELPLEKIDGVKLSGNPITENRSMFYDPYENSAYVIYKTLSEVTKIDLTTEKVVYSVATDFDITSIVAVGGNLSYTYYNSNFSESGKMIVAVFGVDGKIRESLYKTLFIVFIILAAIAFILAVVAALCLLSPKIRGKIGKTFKEMAKSKFVYLAILPSFTLLCMFCFYPAIASIGLSFFDYTQDKPTLLWNNFKHYVNIFTSKYAAEAFSNMGIFLAADLVFALLPPLIFAFFLTIMASRKYSAITRTLLFIPGIIPSVTGLLIWKEGIYGFSGVINLIIKSCGGKEIMFLTQNSTARWATLLMGFPFVGAYLIFYGAMMNISDSYYEAAELEGCGVFKRFLKIDLPLILPQIKYVFVTTFIHSLQNFARTYMIDSKASYGTKTPIHEMYSYMLQGDYGYSAAYATVIFVFLLFATIINMKMQFSGGDE